MAVLVREMFVEGGDARWALADVVKRAAKLRLSEAQIDEVLLRNTHFHRVNVHVLHHTSRRMLPDA